LRQWGLPQWALPHQARPASATPSRVILMRILAMTAAARGFAAAMVEDGAVVAAARLAAERGLPEAIPPAVAELLAAGRAPDLVAVVVGPGSFTGLRASIAVAQGVGLGAGIPVVGVTVAEAVADALPRLDGRSLWVACAARAGRVFVDRDGEVLACAETDLPAGSGRIAVAGDAANAVAAILAARGLDVMLTDARTPLPVHVAAIGQRRAAGELAALAPVPLYVDAPEARLPAGGLRPAPRGTA
jgi:tRNA threonylcarbamoyl adenosine modification protein YeaZ